MRTKRPKKVASTLLLFIMAITLMNPGQIAVMSTADAAAAAAALEVTETQLSGNETIDLTQAGNVDWLHTKGTGVGADVAYIEKAGANAIAFSLNEGTGVEGKQNRGSDANYLAYSWTDGMTGYETGSEDTGFMVMFPTNRGTGAYPAGYDIAVASHTQPSTVVFGIGMWQADVEVSIYGDSVLYETKKASARQAAQVYKYRIDVPANVALKVEVRQVYTHSQHGNMSFSGLAVQADEKKDIELDVRHNQLTGAFALDLTRMGDLDWLHMKGSGVNNYVPIKKADSSLITFSMNEGTGYEGKPNRGSDGSYISYSWTNGMTGYETGNNDTGFLVMFPENRNTGSHPAGYDIELAKQEQDATVIFGIGMWQAKVDVSIYVDGVLYGDEALRVEAGGTARVYKFQIKVPAGAALGLKVRQAETLSKDGNMSFSGMAVSSQEIVDKARLQAEYSKAIQISQGLYTVESWQTFAAARTGAKTVLDNIDATQAEVDGALSALTAAGAGLVRVATNIVIDYSGASKGEYELGSPADQQHRYQTFTVNDGFDMEMVQFKLKKTGTTPSDLIVQLYRTTDGGLPTGAPLATGTVPEELVVDGDYTTARLAYTLDSNTRYALVLTQTTLIRDQYRWLVMEKNVETTSQYFGKSVSGKFQHEAQLGTGILRIIKNTQVDRSNLLSLMEELRPYSSRLYTMSSWTALETELQQAFVVLYNMDASQDDLDAALARLESAAGNLELYTSIEKIAEHVAAIDLAVIKGYTEDSISALNDTLSAVKALADHASDQDKLRAYSKVMNTLAKLKASGKYKYETHSQLTAAFGFEGDKNASLAFLDGSYQIGGGRSMQHGPVAPKQMVTFGVTDTDDIQWYKGEGYLPVFISEYTKDNVRYKIESFGNKHEVDGRAYVVNYSRITAVNHSNETRLLPLVSNNLIAINEAARDTYVVGAGETVVREYAIEADKYEYFDHGATSFTSLTREQVAAQGSFSANYSEMKDYWLQRLSELVDIDLPNKELVNAFKAGYIDTMIIKDKTYLHVGENGYARLFSHDTIGIMVQLIQSGDFHYAKDYLSSIPLTGGINIEMGLVDPDQYWDANWKLPWAYAVYLSKTGDASIFQETMTADDGSVGTVFEKRVKVGARSIESDRTSEGIMKDTWAIDSRGQWTIDNYSALTGLTAYEYIARELYRINQDTYYLEEAVWAKEQYDDLLEKFTARLQQTITQKGLNYIPASVTQSNDENRMKDSRDANWASMYLFGRWLWDGYLYGAEQPDHNINLTMLDATYDYGIDRRWKEGTTDSAYNFGGYPHGFYSSSYNAGYGSAALRGEKYRDMGIKAYEFMIEQSMSGPFSWWEGIAYPGADSPWASTNNQLNVQNAPGGGGSAQHIWGQAVNSKVLVDSLISERIYDQNQKYDIIVGRGIPKEWVLNAADHQQVVAKVRNYPALQGGRVEYAIVRKGNKLEVTLDAHLEQAQIQADAASFSIQLPSMAGNIAAVSTGVVDKDKGIVTVPFNTKSVVITLADLPAEPDNGNGNGNGNNGNGNGSGDGNGSGNGAGNGEDDGTEPETGGHTGNEGSTEGQNPVRLTDIQTHWAHTAIQTAVKREIVKGYGDGTFRPDAQATRSEFTAMLGRALKFPTNASSLSFGDAASIQPWARSYVAHAIQSGIVTGYDDGNFRPDGKITRMELVAMIARALALNTSATATLPFSDGDQIPAWGRAYVAAAYEAGLIQGRGGDRFAPDAQATRAEAVTLILRVIQYLESQ